MVERERKLLVVSCFLCLMTVSLQLATITVLRVGRESTQAHIAKVVYFSYFPPPPPTVYNVQLNLGGGRKRGWSTTLSSLSIFSTLWRNKSVVACLLFFDRQKEIFIQLLRVCLTINESTPFLKESNGVCLSNGIQKGVNFCFNFSFSWKKK